VSSDPSPIQIIAMNYRTTLRSSLLYSERFCDSVFPDHLDFALRAKSSYHLKAWSIPYLCPVLLRTRVVYVTAFWFDE
jgi:hypothetical protein